MTDDLVRLRSDALSRASAVETLEAAYDVWRELELERAQAAERVRGERQRLSEQGSFLMGAARAAGLAAAGEASGLEDAEARLATLNRALDERSAQEAQELDAAIASVRALVRERVERQLARVKPKVTVLLRSLGATRAILHFERPTGDAPVLLLWVFAGALATHYDFLSDDSTEDLHLPPASLFAEEGVDAQSTRPGPDVLRELVRGEREVLPLKGFLPAFVPGGEGADLFFKLQTRGAVLEAEVAEGEGFRNVLSRAEAEQLTGALVRLKVAGQIELDVRVE